MEKLRETFLKNVSSEPKELIAAMLESASNWEEMPESNKNILKAKEELERQLEKQKRREISVQLARNALRRVLGLKTV
jgi:hypothetical protein